MNRHDFSMQRRTFLGQSALGLGAFALSNLLGRSANGSAAPTDPLLASKGFLPTLHHLPQRRL
jgi:hypothetical protein